MKTAEIRKQLEGDFSDEYIDEEYSELEQLENYN